MKKFIASAGAILLAGSLLMPASAANAAPPPAAEPAGYNLVIHQPVWYVMPLNRNCRSGYYRFLQTRIWDPWNWANTGRWVCHRPGEFVPFFY